MKKTLIYLVAAAAIGILVTVLPLITIAQVGIGGTPSTPQAKPLGQGLKQLDGGGKSPQVNNTDLTFLAISFIIALLTYGILGPKAPRRYEWRLGVPPH